MTRVFTQGTYPDISTAVDGQHVLPDLHWPTWIHYGAGTGTNTDRTGWANFEQCWCGVTREIAVSRP